MKEEQYSVGIKSPAWRGNQSLFKAKVWEPWLLSMSLFCNFYNLGFLICNLRSRGHNYPYLIWLLWRQWSHLWKAFGNVPGHIYCSTNGCFKKRHVPIWLKQGHHKKHRRSVLGLNSLSFLLWPGLCSLSHWKSGSSHSISFYLEDCSLPTVHSCPLSSIRKCDTSLTRFQSGSLFSGLYTKHGCSLPHLFQLISHWHILLLFTSWPWCLTYSGDLQNQWAEGLSCICYVDPD